MNCPKCGAPVTAETKFCSRCGFDVQQSHISNQQNDQPQQSNTYAYQAPPYQNPPIKKKKHVGLWIFLIILIILIGLIVWFISSLIFSKPKDLGVSYTMEDYANVLKKTGIQVNLDGMSGDALVKYYDDLDGKKLDINDYNWEFTDYQRVTFSVTPSEATAFVNEIAPGFLWFDDVQVDVLQDGTMAGSGTFDIARLKKDLYSDVADKIPVPLPDKANVYGTGNLSVSDNNLDIEPDLINIGIIPLPDQFMTDKSADVMSDYFERVYTSIPGLEINSLESDTNGNITFDGIIPQTITITSLN